MQTVLSFGYCVTQNTDYIVHISRNGKAIMRLMFSRPLSGEELNELAFYALTR